MNAKFAEIYQQFLAAGRVPVFDGAIGTLLQRYPQITKVRLGEELNIKHPEVVLKVHEDYCQAGADFLTTNTFSANPFRLKAAGLLQQLERLNAQGVALARRVADQAGRPCYVAGSIGPSGELLAPFGPLDFKRAEAGFAQQARILEQAGADLIIIETMDHPREIKAAIAAVRQSTNLPIIASLTYTAHGRTVQGTDPETAVAILENMQVDVIAANCSIGPWELLKVAQAYRGSTSWPVLLEPNAGQPRLRGGQVHYDVGPEEFAQAMHRMLELGVDLIGSCCGSDPRYTELLRRVAAEFRPQPREPHYRPRLAARARSVPLDSVLERWDAVQPLAIGKAEELKTGNLPSMGRQVGQLLLLDLRRFPPQPERLAELERALLQRQISSDLPLGFHVADPRVLECCLRVTDGVPLVLPEPDNADALDRMGELVAHYGGILVDPREL